MTTRRIGKIVCHAQWRIVSKVLVGKDETALSNASVVSMHIIAKTPMSSMISPLPTRDRGVAAASFKVGTYRGFRTAALDSHIDTVGSVEELPNV